MHAIKTAVRNLMCRIANVLNRVSGGRITPNHITWSGLLAHIPIGVLIGADYLVIAGVLLIIFGLFDTLDGELSRLQKTSSASGMFLDSFTDRLKEVWLYIGIGWWSVYYAETAWLAVLAIACVGISVLISYLNAWGEAVLANHSKNGHAVNKTFRGGILGFEVRMFLLVIAFLFDSIPAVLYIILVLGITTLVVRFFSITGRLSRV